MVIEAGLFRPSRATRLTPFFSPSLRLSPCQPPPVLPLISNLLSPPWFRPIFPPFQSSPHPSSTPPRSLPSGRFLPSFLLLPAFFPSSPLRGLQSPQPLLIKLREIGCPRPNNPRGRQAGHLLPLSSPPPHLYITASSILLYSTCCSSSIPPFNSSLSSSPLTHWLAPPCCVLPLPPPLHTHTHTIWISCSPTCFCVCL